MIPDVRISDPWGSAVYQLYRAGVLVGTEKTGTFSPANRISRAEAAAIIARMVEPFLRLSISLTAGHEEAPG